MLGWLACACNGALRTFAFALKRSRWSLAEAAFAGALCSSCSLAADADRAQCATNSDCEDRGSAFRGSVCFEGVCRADDRDDPCDGGACKASPATATDACVGTGCRDAAKARDARSEASHELPRETSDADTEPPDAQEPSDAHETSPGECVLDSDCAARGLVGALCVDAVCWQVSDKDQCSVDTDCSALGPEFVDGRCLDAQCRPNPKWRCEPPMPASDSQSLMLHALVRDSLSLSPVRDLHAVLCEKLDLDCIEPVTEATTDREGQLEFEVPHGFAGYLRIEDARFVPALYFLPAALPEDGELQPVPLLGVGVVDALAFSIDAEVDPRRGHMMLISEDCFGMALEGVSFASPEKDASTIQFYVRDLLPTTGATETGDIGNGGYLNFRAGAAVIDITAVDLGLKLTTVSVVVRPGFITVAYVRPDLR